MCHCLQARADLTDEERAAIIAEHSEAELRDEYSSDELEQLGIAV